MILRWLYGFSLSALAPPLEHDGDGGSESKQADVVPYVVPSHAIESNSAIEIAKAIRKWRPASRRRLLNAARTRIVLEIRESDAASANITYINHMALNALKFQTGGERILLVHQLCLLHQSHLIVGMCVKLIGGPTIPLPSLLYCVSKVLRNPGYWESVLLTVPRTVGLCLVIKETGWTQDCRTVAVTLTCRVFDS